MKIEAKFENLDSTLAAMREFPGNYDKIVVQTMRGLAEEIMSEAKSRTPVVTGALRSSGHIQGPTDKGRGVVEVVLGFGGTAGSGNHGGATNTETVGYAEIVHENPRAGKTGGVSPSGESYGDRYSQVGGDKFLENPINEALPQIDGLLAAAIEEAAKLIR